MANSIEFTPDEINTIENALNCYWHDAHNNLQRKDLGDIERVNYERIATKSKEIMNKIDTH